MSAEEAGRNTGDPATLYSEQLKTLDRKQADEQAREKRLGWVKLAIAAFTVASAVVLVYLSQFLWLILVPAAAFVWLTVMHEQQLESIQLRQRSIEFYKRGLARIEDRWAGTGESGEQFLDEMHPYARDLDLFGRAGLFELLNTARTRAGEERLASWLLEAAPADEIAARQAAIRDLKDRVKFREELFCLGQKMRREVRPDELAKWGERGPVLTTSAIRLVTTLLGVVWIAGMIAWGAWGLGTLALAISALNLAWAHRIHARWEEAADQIENATHDLSVLAGVLRLVENGQFGATKLREIQNRLKHDGFKPSEAIARLARIVNYLESRRNPALRLMDVLMFWSPQFIFAAEGWQRDFGPHIRGWLAAVSEFEALTSLAGYAFEHPGNVFPEIVERGPQFEAEGLTHPLLPARAAVSNDIKLGDGLQLIVLSGPNMAGKSTFIRCVGVNAVLAQCGAPVSARRLRMSALAVAASICVLDSLSGGTSRFYAEIRRLKLAENLSEGAVPVLFLMDELLSGTNSHDRLEGTKLVVRSLMDRGAIGIVSTHDLALAEIPATLEGRAANYHFEDRLEDGKLIFDYKLKPGVVKTSNALQLMRSIGLGTASAVR